MTARDMASMFETIAQQGAAAVPSGSAAIPIRATGPRPSLAKRRCCRFAARAGSRAEFSRSSRASRQMSPAPTAEQVKQGQAPRGTTQPTGTPVAWAA